ncbi:hypothetical protein F4818DRAFT_444383 [Hypoxylon cercidicola]|nr:hypothetical protein F4818DRAFT_444383 [Hypoxylon cercidicola]
MHRRQAPRAPIQQASDARPPLQIGAHDGLLRFRTGVNAVLSADRRLHGRGGVKGRASVKWQSVSCQACYEDRVLNNGFINKFEPTEPQPVGDTWACDMAELFIEKWFVPKNGPEGLVLCAACYCDQVIHTGEVAKWEAAESWTRAYDKYVRCGMGIFSIKMAMAGEYETKDFSAFWTAVDKLNNEKFCKDDDIEDDVRHTLPSDPSHFGICAGRYEVAIAEPLHVSQQFAQRLLETYFTHDWTSFDNFASECYYEFAQHSPLASQMHLKNTLLETSTMCEMYSRRMRNLFKECSGASWPEYSIQRQLVWMQTVPQIRMMLFRAKMALNQQQSSRHAGRDYDAIHVDVRHGWRRTRLREHEPPEGAIGILSAASGGEGSLNRWVAIIEQGVAFIIKRTNPLVVIRPEI